MKTILITGASSTLGMRIIKKIIKKNYKLICLVNSRRLPKYNSKMLIFKSNFENINCLTKLNKNLNSLNLKFSTVIHLACPKIKLKRFYEYSWQEINSHIQIQFRSLFLIIKNLIQNKKLNSTLKFFIISSYATKIIPPKGMMPYILTKNLIEKYFEILKNELIGVKIKIFIIRPKEFNSSLRSLLPESQSLIKKDKSIIEINKVTKFIEKNI